MEIIAPNGDPDAGTFVLFPEGDPKHIEFIAPDGKQRFPGIYQFEGAHLKLALIDGSYPRPADFTPSELPDHLTATFKHANP